MTKMSRLALIAGFALGLAACGSDDKPDVIWDCTCTGTCNGATQTLTQQGCGTDDDADATVKAEVATCMAELTPVCDTASCNCNCTPTETECTPE